jgi:hypothetical protein
VLETVTLPTSTSFVTRLIPNMRSNESAQFPGGAALASRPGSTHPAAAATAQTQR